MPVRLYTDGSCLTHGWLLGGPGGWAHVTLTDDGEINERSLKVGSVKHTTSTEMEVFAAIRALKSLPVGSDVILHTDCMTIPLVVSIYDGDGGFARGAHAKRMSRTQTRLWLDLIEAVARHANVKIVYLERSKRRQPEHAAHQRVHESAKTKARAMNHKRFQRGTNDPDWTRHRKPEARAPYPPPASTRTSPGVHLSDCSPLLCVIGCPVWEAYGGEYRRC